MHKHIILFFLTLSFLLGFKEDALASHSDTVEKFWARDINMDAATRKRLGDDMENLRKYWGAGYSPVTATTKHFGRDCALAYLAEQDNLAEFFEALHEDPRFTKDMEGFVKANNEFLFKKAKELLTSAPIDHATQSSKLKVLLALPASLLAMAKDSTSSIAVLDHFRNPADAVWGERLLVTARILRLQELLGVGDPTRVVPLSLGNIIAFTIEALNAGHFQSIHALAKKAPARTGTYFTSQDDLIATVEWLEIKYSNISEAIWGKAIRIGFGGSISLALTYIGEQQKLVNIIAKNIPAGKPSKQASRENIAASMKDYLPKTVKYGKVD